MRTFHDRLVPSAVLDEADECRKSIGETLAKGYKTLATIARNSETIAAVNHARTIADKDRWAHLCREWKPSTMELKAINAILDTMPGYCCQNDAVNLAARL